MLMIFREKLEGLMTEAQLNDVQRDHLVDWAVKQIFNAGTCSIGLEQALSEIVNQIETLGLHERFDEIMNSTIDFNCEYEDDFPACR